MNILPEIQFLESLMDFGIKLGLEKTRYILEQLGNPHLKYPSVLVAGTNGKGSVARALANILTVSGYKTGLYTSPHLVSVEERIQIDGEKIPKAAFAEEVRRLRQVLSEEPYQVYPTFFEALTAIAFSYFAKERIEILVCEVGMGGRFDATNVLPSVLAVITRIGKDHTQYLGNTYEEIANEKAGIIKEGAAVVSAKQPSGAMGVLLRKAKERKADLYYEGKHFRSRGVSRSIEGQIFSFFGQENILREIKTPLQGRHQIKNMSMVAQSAILLKQQGFKIPLEAVYEGIETTVWPCRFQILRREPYIILDGAHNPDGVKALLKTLTECFPGIGFSFLMGALKDKDWKKMLALVLDNERAEEIVFTVPGNTRAISPDVLAGYVSGKKRGMKVKVIKEQAQAIRYIKETGKNWCICGSLYLCGDIMRSKGFRNLL